MTVPRLTKRLLLIRTRERYRRRWPKCLETLGTRNDSWTSTRARGLGHRERTALAPHPALGSPAR